MHPIVGISLIVLLACPVTLIRADDRAKALATLEEAIKAHGGESALAKTRLMTRKISGTLTLGQQFIFNAEITQDVPDRSRAVFELGAGNQKIFLVLVRNGDKGWRSTGGAVAEMTKDEVEDLKDEGYLWWVLGLLPLRMNAFELAPLAERMIDARPAAGLKVASKGHEDIKLWFDKTTGLLVKAERRGKEVGLAVDKEYSFADHKPFEGVVLPTKYLETTNAKKFVEASSMSYQFPSKVEDGTFARP